MTHDVNISDNRRLELSKGEPSIVSRHFTSLVNKHTPARFSRARTDICRHFTSGERQTHSTRFSRARTDICPTRADEAHFLSQHCYCDCIDCIEIPSKVAFQIHQKLGLATGERGLSDNRWISEPASLRQTNSPHATTCHAMDQRRLWTTRTYCTYR